MHIPNRGLNTNTDQWYTMTTSYTGSLPPAPTQSAQHSPWARPQPYRTSRPGFQNTHTSPMRFLCFQTHTPTSGIPPNTYYRSPRTSNTHTATIGLHVLIHMYTSQTPMDTHGQIFPTLEHTDAPNTTHGATSPEENHPAPNPNRDTKGHCNSVGVNSICISALTLNVDTPSLRT